MNEFFVPTSEAETELVEKRSRFIGHIFIVSSEVEARARIDEVKKRRYDARHNCWCYRIHGAAERCSDDGEPQGTAGVPMLNVFQRQGVENVCCVVTRYFGGVLLGAGGLARAYGQSAGDALEAAGISVVRRWVAAAVRCPYGLFERLKLEAGEAGGAVGEAEYAADVRVRVLLPEGAVEGFTQRVTELTAGGSAVELLGEAFKAVPK